MVLVTINIDLNFIDQQPIKVILFKQIKKKLNFTHTFLNVNKLKKIKNEKPQTTAVTETNNNNNVRPKGTERKYYSLRRVI